MKKIIIIFSVLIAFIYAKNSRPVIVSGGGDDFHGYLCDSYSEIRGIDKHGDGFVAIRSGPGSKYSIKKKVYKNGTGVNWCESVGNWVGIVYRNTEHGDFADECGFKKDTYQKPHIYKGNCPTGWVYKKYIEIVGG